MLQPMFYYMVKLSVSLAAVPIFYYMLLRQLTQFKQNRWFMLGGLALSFIIPLININSFGRQQEFGKVIFANKIPPLQNIIPALPPQTNSVPGGLQSVILLLFASIPCILLLRLALQFLSLKKISRQAQLLSKGAVLLYNIPQNIAPFSFHRSIYLNASMYTTAELADVIRHETIHVQQKHTIDVLLAEIVCAVNWYNPFAWVLKKAIKQNLEFIADEKVLQSNTNRKNYQYLLLKVNGSLPFGIINNLNFPSLKKRIAMMNKAKTSRLHLLKFLFILPIACVLLVAFRQTSMHYDGASNPSTKQGTSESFTLGTLTYVINNKGAEMIVKNEQHDSFLKPGSALSLSLIQNEKLRLSNLLQQNGFDTSGGHAIYFMVDTFSTNKSFSIQVNINVPPNKGFRKGSTSAVHKTIENGLDDNRLKSIPASQTEKTTMAYPSQGLKLMAGSTSSETAI